MQPTVANGTGHGQSPRQRHASLCLLLFIALGIYVAVYLFGYLTSPSGRFPLLDGAENMTLARQIAEGALPQTPFFRAMLYPGLLSLFLLAGVTPDWLPVVAGILGCAFHLGSTAFVYGLARRAWSSGRAGIVAAVLFGFNPVAIYFASEPLDATLGMFLFLAGMNFFHAGVLTVRRASHTKQSVFSTQLTRRFAMNVAGGTAFWVLAMLARPHYALLVAGLPFLLVAGLIRAPQFLIRSLLIFVIVAGAGLGAAGLTQKQVCGEFRIMPTQGAFNLWAGNRPGANGRYYEQKIHIAPGNTEGENPARIESETLYRAETGDTETLVIDRLTNYWRKKTLTSIRENPVSWLGLMTRKAYYLFNNFEQYNNKTFAIQKEISSALKFNPLGWGLTLVLCATGLTLASFARRRCQGAALGFAVAGLYGLGVILFFVSDRFRLPLLPFLCIGAGAWGWAFRSSWSAVQGYKGAFVVVAALAASLLTFSRGWGAHDLTAVVQDYVGLSIAAGKAGDDAESLRWARRALAERPDHPDALACAVNGFYNLMLSGAPVEQEFHDETWQLQLQRTSRIANPAPSVKLTEAVAFWKTGRTNDARMTLRSLLPDAQSKSVTPKGDDALGVLLLTRLAEETDKRQAAGRARETTSAYLLVALDLYHTAAAKSIPPAKRPMIDAAKPVLRNIFP